MKWMEFLEDFNQQRRLARAVTLLKELKNLEKHIPNLDDDERAAAALELKPFFDKKDNRAIEHDRVREVALFCLVQLGATDIVRHVADTDASGYICGEAQAALRQMIAMPRAQNDNARLDLRTQRELGRIVAKLAL